MSVCNKEKFSEGGRIYLTKDKWDLDIERHKARYEFAKKYIERNFIVLDAACGSGYGSEIIAKAAKKIIGIDNSKSALDWGNKYHKRKNIEFREANLNEQLNFKNNTFDAIISFETLEHVRNYHNMLSEFRRILKPGGILILSTPNRNATQKYSDKFHLKEFSKKELLDLLNNYFKIENLFGQTPYIEISGYKKSFISIIKPLVIFRKILILLGLGKLFQKLIWMKKVSIQQTSLNDPVSYLNLICVCKNERKGQ